MLKKIFTGLLQCLFLTTLVSLSACQSANASGGTNGTDTTASQNETTAPATPTENETPAATEGESSTLLQFMPIQKGEELAVLHTTMGDIKLRFFPVEAPKAVENFITHAKAGYYDGVNFHRVINDFMIQGGDPKGTGTGGESIWGGGFASEFSLNLHHFKGALSMAHSEQPDSNGSQFFIVQNHNLNEQYKAYFEDMRDKQDELLAQSEDGQSLYVRDIFPTAMLDEYINNGGTPHLDMILNENGHTVFGQVVEGMDIVDAIAAVSVGANDKPLTDVIINSISFEIYS